jgi:peptidyl-prolyl cis-trans isomerase B (cyclophilin B)
LLIALLAGCATPTPGTPTTGTAPNAQTLPGAVLHTTAGDITWVFYPDAAPATVAHVSSLIRSGYYDGKGFGRIVPGHVIQQVERDGGTLTDDKGTVPLEAPAGYHFSAGAVGIARGADPNSGGPEFFIMDYATSHLDGNYSVFAQVVAGLDVVHASARQPAIDFPAQAQLITDRYAVLPTTMTATLADVPLDGPTAATLPLQVAKDVRVGDYRNSLEWPHDLRPGHESRLTWYVRPYNNAPSLDAASLRLTIDGHAVPLSAQPGYPDILAFTWTPPASGAHDATLSRDGQAFATLTLAVP